MKKDKCFECTLWKELGILILAITATYFMALITFS